MSKSQKVALGLVNNGEEGGEARQHERTAYFWYELASVMAEVVDRGGLVSVYTSRDGGATGIRVKAGKDTKAYWLGPDDGVVDVINAIGKDWGLSMKEDILYPEIERAIATATLEGQDGAKEG